MADYINRAELLELYSINEELEDAEKLQVPFMVVRQNILDMPSADVRENVHGEWVEYPECLGISDAYSSDDICCSCCKAVFNVIDNDTERFNFCPNCGADMRIKEKGK